MRKNYFAFLPARNMLWTRTAQKRRNKNYQKNIRNLEIGINYFAHKKEPGRKKRKPYINKVIILFYQYLIEIKVGTTSVLQCGVAVWS